MLLVLSSRRLFQLHKETVEGLDGMTILLVLTSVNSKLEGNWRPNWCRQSRKARNSGLNPRDTQLLWIRISSPARVQNYSSRRI